EKLHSGGGDRNPYNPLLMGLPAPSNFYTREIKKMRLLVGMMPIPGSRYRLIRDHLPASWRIVKIW
ncbi:TPA: hypothetical protein ACHLAH_001111, partial [Escherichia coli]